MSLCHLLSHGRVLCLLSALLAYFSILILIRNDKKSDHLIVPRRCLVFSYDHRPALIFKARARLTIELTIFVFYRLLFVFKTIFW